MEILRVNGLAFFVTISILLAMWLSYKYKKTDAGGTLVGGIVALLLFIGGGLPALFWLFVFFVAGTQATRWKNKSKMGLFYEEKSRQTRSMANVLANAGPAAICAFLALLFPVYYSTWLMMAAGSLATACSDTLSSELGTIYG